MSACTTWKIYRDFFNYLRPYTLGKCDLLIGRLMIYSSLVGDHLDSNLDYGKISDKLGETMVS